MSIADMGARLSLKHFDQSPRISIYAVFHNSDFIVGFPTMTQAEGYLKADKRELVIREGLFPAPGNDLSALRLSRISPKLGSTLRGGSPHDWQEEIKKLMLGGSKIDVEADKLKAEYIFRNKDGAEVRIPQSEMHK